MTGRDLDRFPVLDPVHGHHRRLDHCLGGRLACPGPVDFGFSGRKVLGLFLFGAPVL